MFLSEKRMLETLRFKHNSISASNDLSREEKSIDNYFNKQRGQIGINLIELDTMSDTGRFEVIIQSKTQDKPLVTEIEAEIKNGKVVDNTMETVNQDLGFFSDAVNDVFNYSRGKVAELYPDYKKDTDEYDFTKMQALAIKVNENIEKSLFQKVEIKNEKQLQEENEIKSRKPKKNMSFGMAM